MVMERLERTKELSENQNPTKQFAIEQARELLVVAGVKDPGPKLEEGLVAKGQKPITEPLTSGEWGNEIVGTRVYPDGTTGPIRNRDRDDGR